MHPHAKLIEKFYSAFQNLDGESMAECYHPKVFFSDPVFPRLEGKEATAMWKMLCSQARDFSLSFDTVEADNHLGKTRWEANYTFSLTGRKVRNKIDANFEFKDGKIICHSDQFSFWKWSVMALGSVGLLLGWTPLIRNRVRQQAAINLEKFIQHLPE